VPIRKIFLSHDRVNIVVAQGVGAAGGAAGLDFEEFGHARLAQMTADVLTEARDEIGTNVAEVSRRLEQDARTEGQRGAAPQAL
jgi:hypothetical protein